jgi:hypothetical protein
MIKPRSKFFSRFGGALVAAALVGACGREPSVLERVRALAATEPLPPKQTIIYVPLTGLWPICNLGWLDVVANDDVEARSLTIEWTEAISKEVAASAFSKELGLTAGVAQVRYDVPTAFEVDNVEPRTANEIYVGGYPLDEAGNADDNRYVIERWDLLPSMGWPYTKRLRSSIPIGSPTPFSSLEVELQGGVLTPLESRAPLTIVRETILELETGAAGFDIDPEGRFLIYVVPAQGVYQLPLGELAEPARLIFSTAEHSDLASASSVELSRLTSGERVIGIGLRDLEAGSYAADAENDGVFETFLTITDTNADKAGLFDLDTWSDNYVRYRLPLVLD